MEGRWGKFLEHMVPRPSEGAGHVARPLVRVAGLPQGGLGVGSEVHARGFVYFPVGFLVLFAAVKRHL